MRMALLTISRARGWTAAVPALLVALVVAACTRQLWVPVPLADGARTTALLVGALHPALASVLVIDHVPGLSTTLARERLMRALELGGFWLANGAMAAILSAGGDAAHHLFQLTSSLLLADVALILASTMGTTGVLGSCLAAVAWVVGAGTLATALGYSDGAVTAASLPGWRLQPRHLWQMAVLIAVGTVTSLHVMAARHSARATH